MELNVSQLFKPVWVVFKGEGAATAVFIHKIKLIAACGGVAVWPVQPNMTRPWVWAWATINSFVVAADLEGGKCDALRAIDDKFVAVGG